MIDSVSLSSFVEKLKPYYPPITYKKAVDWAHAGDLPVWPRIRPKERFKINLPLIRPFLKRLELSEILIDALLQEFNS